MEDNEDQPEDVRVATPVESEIERAEVDEPSSEPPRDFPPESSDSPPEDIPRRPKRPKEEECAKKLKKKMKKDAKSQTVTVLIPDEPCTLPRIAPIPRHCLSKKEWIDLLATPSRKCPASCGKKPVERKLRPISPRIDELAKPPKHRMLNTLEARGEILPAELVDRLVRVLEGETCLTPEQAERLLRDRRRKSSKKSKRRRHSCKSDDVNLKSPQSYSPLPFDKEAVTCQYLMAEAFVKSILQWKSTIPKDEFKDIADIIIKRLGTTLEYTPVDKADKTTQQMRFLADIIAAWIAGVLFEVAEGHREELEKEWEERKKMMEEQEEESESSESEVEEFVPMKKEKSKISEKSREETEPQKETGGGKLVDGTDGKVPGGTEDKTAEQEEEQEQEKSDEKPKDSPKKDDEDDGTGAGGTSEEQPPPEDAPELPEPPEEPPADDKPPGGDAEEPEPTEAVESSDSPSEVPVDEAVEPPGTAVPSEKPSKTGTEAQEIEGGDDISGDGTENEGRESEITLVPGTVPPMEFEPTSEAIPEGDSETVPDTVPATVPDTASGTVPGAVPDTVPGTVPDTAPGTVPGTVPDTTPGTVPETVPDTTPGTVPDTAPGTVPDTAPGTVPPTPGEPDGVSLKTDVLPESASVPDGTIPGTVPGTVPPTPGEPDGVSIRTEGVPDGTVPGIETTKSEVPSEHTKFQDVPEQQKVYITPAEVPGVKSGVGTEGTQPGTTPGIKPGTTPETKPGTKPGTTPGTTPGATAGTTPGTKPGIKLRTTPGTDGTRTPMAPKFPKDDFLEGNLKQILQTDVPFLDLLRILERIENAVAKERENLGDDLTTDRIHRAIYEKLERLARAENPERFSSHLQDVLDVLSGKVAHWVKDALTSSELQFLEEHPPLIGSEELRTFGEWISEVSERTETWIVWMQNMMDQLLKMQAAPVTRIDWQNWTRKFASDAILWRRYFLESSHHAHHNRTMLAGRQIVRTEDFKYPEWRESQINTID